jgi:hypothetical protein
MSPFGKASGAVGLGLLLFIAWDTYQTQQQDIPTDTGSTTIDGLLNDMKITTWTPAKIPAQYADAIAAAEAACGCPQYMLARQLWQESRYRADAYNAISGARGIAQFLPATAAEWGVDVNDPLSSIAGMGRYMNWLYKQTGNWRDALAAYNWGIGNLRKKGIANAPTETRNYYAQILGDIGATAYV